MTTLQLMTSQFLRPGTSFFVSLPVRFVPSDNAQESQEQVLRVRFAKPLAEAYRDAAATQRLERVSLQQLPVDQVQNGTFWVRIDYSGQNEREWFIEGISAKGGDGGLEVVATTQEEPFLFRIDYRFDPAKHMPPPPGVGPYRGFVIRFRDQAQNDVVQLVLPADLL